MGKTIARSVAKENFQKMLVILWVAQHVRLVGIIQKQVLYNASQFHQAIVPMEIYLKYTLVPLVTYRKE